MAEPFTLETVFTSTRFFGIEQATQVQRACCRIAEGLPLGDLACDPDVREAVGGDEALAILAPGGVRPRELDLLCAIRSGKSFFVAAHQFWSAMTAQIDHLKAGEIPRHPVLSVNLRSAEATFNILLGNLMARSAMRPLLVGDPGQDTLTLRHPSGRLIECIVAAGARAGANLVSVWLTGCAFEEYARQAGEGAGAVVNYDEQLRAAAGRVVDGGQILSVSSPWAPFGPAYDRFTAHFGKPSPARVVIKATGPMMNPAWWTPARCEALQRSNPTAYMTDVLAGFADAATSLFAASDVRRATPAGVRMLEPRPGARYVAAMDPATRGDRWTLVIVEHEPRGDGTEVVRVALVLSWRGTPAQPLRPDAVLGEIATVLRRYDVDTVWSDQLAGDFVVSIAQRFGLTVLIETLTAASKLEMFTALPLRLADGSLQLLDDEDLRTDLIAVRKIVTRTGVAIDLPRTASGHCDTAMALALAVTKGAGAAAPSSIRAMEREAERRGADREPASRLQITYDTAPDGRARAIGTLDGRPAGEARWTPGQSDTTTIYQGGASTSFLDALTEDMQAKQIV